jgi:putative transposase
VKRRWTHKRPRPGPPTRPAIRELAVRMAAENPGWGYRRIAGELAHLGRRVAPSTAVWAILKQAGIDPAPHRSGLAWGEFLRAQAEGFSRVISFMQRRSRSRGCTASRSLSTLPAGCLSWALPRIRPGWVTQQARNLLMDLGSGPGLSSS